MIPIPPIAALTPMPPLAPGDKPLHDWGVLVMLGGFEVELARGPEEVGVATFQPLNWMALIQVEDWTDSVVLFTSFVKEAKYVMVWPGIKGDVHVPTALPGSPF